MPWKKNEKEQEFNDEGDLTSAEEDEFVEVEADDFEE